MDEIDIQINYYMFMLTIMYHDMPDYKDHVAWLFNLELNQLEKGV